MLDVCHSMSCFPLVPVHVDFPGIHSTITPHNPLPCLSRNEDAQAVSKDYSTDASPVQTSVDHSRKRLDPAACVCIFCGRAFSQKSALNVHVDAVHSKTLHSCPVCQQTFSWKRALQRHVQAVHERRTYQCFVCQRTFSRQDSLQKHLKTTAHSRKCMSRGAAGGKQPHYVGRPRHMVQVSDVSQDVLVWIDPAHAGSGTAAGGIAVINDGAQ